MGRWFFFIGRCGFWRVGVAVGTAFDFFVDNDGNDDANGGLDNAVDNIKLGIGCGAGKIGDYTQIYNTADGDGIFFVNDIADINGDEHTQGDDQ